MDEERRWNVRQPAASEEASYVQNYLNPRYGSNRPLIYRSVPALVTAAVSKSDGEIL